jgi:hypothetical protein
VYLWNQLKPVNVEIIANVSTALVIVTRKKALMVALVEKTANVTHATAEVENVLAERAAGAVTNLSADLELNAANQVKRVDVVAQIASALTRASVQRENAATRPAAAKRRESKLEDAASR